MVHQSRIRPLPVPISTPQSLVFEYDILARMFKFANYQPISTQNRASFEEVEQFLTEVNEPLAEWEEKYGNLARGKGKIMYLALISFILFPLFFVFICWSSGAQKHAQDAQKECVEKAKNIIRDKSDQWTYKGLCWHVPSQFPKWIELWTSVDGRGGAPVSQMPGVGAGAEYGMNYSNQNLYSQNNSYNV